MFFTFADIVQLSAYKGTTLCAILAAKLEEICEVTGFNPGYHRSALTFGGFAWFEMEGS
jgi:hypothetical protein